MRVYLPSSSSALSELHRGGSVGPAPLTGFAVTPGLRKWYVDDDEEALEYAALLDAARASLRLIDADASAARRRVVLAVDVADGDLEVRDDLDRGVVRVLVPVPIATVASVHADDADAEATVLAAAAAIDDADLGEDDAQERVDDAEGHELGWFATQEIADLLAGM